MEKDLGAIDGISYRAVAEPLKLEEFLALEALPELFKTVTLTFRYENGGESRFSVIPGEAFHEEKIPKIPEKAGFVASWQGLEDADLDLVIFDQTFEANYRAFDMVLSSDNGAKPMMLIQGGFLSDSALTVTDWEEPVALEEGQTLLASKGFAVTKGQYLSTIRFCVGDTETDDLALLIRGQDGSWRKTESKADGSYLVAALCDGDNAVALVQESTFPWGYVAAGAGVLALALILLMKKRKK